MSDQRYKTAKIYISLKHGETITKELHTQFKEGRNCDLEIRLNKKRLYVHKCLIDIFFIKAGAELEDDRFFLDLTGYSQPVVEALIGLIYTGNLRCSLDQVEKVYKAAVELGCVEAQTGCQTYLRENGIPFVSSSGNSRDSSSSPGVPHIPYSTTSSDPTQPELEPDFIVKSEPIDDFNGSNNSNTDDSAKQADSGTGRYHYRSTYLVPVTGSNSASTLLSYKYSGNLPQNTQYSVSNANLHTAVPAMQSFKTSSKTNLGDSACKQTDMSQCQGRNDSGKRKGGQPIKVVTKDLANKKVFSPDHSNADSNSSSQNEFSADNDEDNGESEGKTVSEEPFTNVSTLVKIERDIDDVSAGTSSVEDNIDAQKKEQMFSLGLAKKTDIKTSEIGVNNSGKRRLRTRKKVNYNSINIERSDFDDSSDYDPLEDVIPKKKLKSQAASKGKKVDPSSLVSLGQSRKTEKVQNEELVISPTVAVRQDHLTNDYDNGIESDERVYFPPAGSVPTGVNSQYAQGTFLKVKYVTETITDADGNVTVISKRVPMRPRQFGLDERLRNRPSVYVCHPTAPVVKPVVGKHRP